MRPGSYNILSPRYADRPNLFQSAGVLTIKTDKTPPFELTKTEKAALEKLLAEAGLSRSAKSLLAYAEKAISGRELGKFVFSRNLSDVLEAIAFWAEDMNLSRKNASYLPVQALLNLNFKSALKTRAQ